MVTLGMDCRNRKAQAGMGSSGAHGPQGGGLLVGKAGQAAAPQGLHDPDGNMPAIQQLHLFAAVLEGPVDVVQLQLTELHILAVGVQKPLQHRQVPVAGEAQVADTAAPLLLHQIVVDAVLRVQIGVDVHLTDVVEEIEIKIVHPALFQLLLKNLLHLGHVGQVVTGELVGNVKFFPGMFGQGLTQGNL